ncbi:nucleotidyltransferase [Gardnerella vaginalis]|uniref:nucleotidyltransferase n=1 Tax=Gardnerella vaginalis TaxID=2702 RepID=UPI0039F0DE25
MNPPHWLSDFVLPNQNESDFNYSTRLFHVFEPSFNPSNIYFRGHKVIGRRRSSPQYGLYECFQHIITKDNNDKSVRSFDFERAKRIKWVKDCICNYPDCKKCSYKSCEKPLVWEEQYKGVTRIHILLPSARYLVVLEDAVKKHDCYYLITAFYAHYDNYIDAERNRYERAKRINKTIQ